MGLYTRHNNCMSYALVRKEWSFPKGWRTARYNPTEENIAFMIKALEGYGLKPIKREDMVLGKEYVVFRYGWDEDFALDDFHFARREKTGHWSHKMGGGRPKGISEKMVFAESWDFGNSSLYDSPVYLFERL